MNLHGLPRLFFLSFFFLRDFVFVLLFLCLYVKVFLSFLLKNFTSETPTSSFSLPGHFQFLYLWNP